MDVYFSDSKFEARMKTSQTRRRAFGPERNKKLEQRRAQIDAADTLVDLRNAPGHWHALTGDLAGHFATSLDGPYRLIFAPLEFDTLDDGSMDWSSVTAIVLEGIQNYHD